MCSDDDVDDSQLDKATQPSLHDIFRGWQFEPSRVQTSNTENRAQPKGTARPTFCLYSCWYCDEDDHYLMLNSWPRRLLRIGFLERFVSLNQSSNLELSCPTRCFLSATVLVRFASLTLGTLRGLYSWTRGGNPSWLSVSKSERERDKETERQRGRERERGRERAT